MDGHLGMRDFNNHIFIAELGSGKNHRSWRSSVLILNYYILCFCYLLIAAAFIWISICFKGIQAHKIAGLAVSGILIIEILYYLGIRVLPAGIGGDIYDFGIELWFKIGFSLYDIIFLLALASYSVFFLSFGLTKAAGFDAVIKPDDSTVKS